MSTTDLRGILAANLRRMIDRERVSVRAWALARGLDVRLIDRMTKGDNSVTIDTLHKIADACGLQAWHLLVPDVDPTAPPAPPITAEDRALLKRLRRLLDE